MLQRPDWTRSAGHVSITTPEDHPGRCESCPRPRTVDSVCGQVVRGLEAAHGSLGQGTVTSVDRAGRIAQAGQPTLQGPNGTGAMRTGVAGPEREQLRA